MRGQVVSVNGIAGVLLCGGLLWCALWSPAQGNPPKTPSKGQDAPLLTPAAIDERLTAVEERLAHVRAQLALLPTAAADTTPPAGATAEEWSEHKELLHRLENFYQSHLDALRELRQHVEKLFTEYGIMIAFPQQDVHLDSPTPLKVEVVTHTTADGAGQAVQPA